MRISSLHTSCTGSSDVEQDLVSLCWALCPGSPLLGTGVGSQQLRGGPLSFSCTSCLSAQWPCFWCAQQHACVSNQSRCEASPNPTVSRAQGCPLPPLFLFFFDTLRTFPCHYIVFLGSNFNRCRAGLVVTVRVNQSLCHSLLQGIFPTRGLNSGLLHCRQILHHLSHQGSPSNPLLLDVLSAPLFCVLICAGHCMALTVLWRPVLQRVFWGESPYFQLS